jgi:hypothetical protein
MAWINSSMFFVMESKFFRPCLVRKKNLGGYTVAFSFLFDKHCPIMEELGSKDSSRDLQLNCAISFIFIYI